MAQLAKTFYPYDPLPAQDLNDIVGFLNGVASGANLEPGSISTDTLAESAVTASKLNPLARRTLVGVADSTGNINTSGANAFQTIPGATVTFTAVADERYMIELSGGSVVNGTAGGTNVNLQLAQGTTNRTTINFSVPASVAMPCPTVRYLLTGVSGSTTFNARGSSATGTNVQWNGSGGAFTITASRV